MYVKLFCSVLRFCIFGFVGQIYEIFSGLVPVKGEFRASALSEVVRARFKLRHNIVYILRVQTVPL